MSSCDYATRRGGTSASSPSTTVGSPTPRSPARSYRPYPREVECASLEIPIPCSSPPIPVANVAVGNPGYLFQFRELQIATNGFNSKNSLCKGGFGNVYKGKLQNKTLIAVKRLNDDGDARWCRKVEQRWPPAEAFAGEEAVSTAGTHIAACAGEEEEEEANKEVEVGPHHGCRHASYAEAEANSEKLRERAMERDVGG
ncbi:hypothetical protein ZIOFF_012850 [Zingiber officinale]|uniref:Protein kinase domain-containing protein n=1 Tax=Zingiber officinale TaxID=94328 RepID=A0A8J5HPX1_ZINOF|nr:hypothetical protein ZIOFF_012850 [Zingiber officinale]